MESRRGKLERSGMVKFYTVSIALIGFYRIYGGLKVL